MSPIQPDFQRIVTTLHHEDPARVPLVEAAVDYKIMSEFLGREVTDDDVAAQVDFWCSAGYDYIPLTIGMMRPGKVTIDSKIARILRESLGPDEDEETWDLWKKPRVHDEADFEAFPWELAAKPDLTKFYEVQKYLPPGMKIIAMSGKIFTLSWMLMGFEDFAVTLKLDPEFATRAVGRIAQIQLDGVRQVVSIPNVAAVWAVDDLAYKTGPIVSPEDLRRDVFPWYEELANLCRAHGLYFFFHSDGVLWDLFEDLLAVGVDAIHPIDPTCMDIEAVKEKIGTRTALFGNISTELLEYGTPDEIAAITKQRLRRLAPGGGYALGSGNSVPDWAQIDNYRAMLRTGLEFGRYPIHIP